MKSVLLVEDDPQITRAYTARLQSLGYVVHTARDARSAVSEARRLNPDVLLLDISLPAGDGFSVAERINDPMVPIRTPVIFITASYRSGLQERAMEMGAVALLRKPFDATQLAGALDMALFPGGTRRPRRLQS